MLNADDNRLLTEVGPDKPMGRLFREYWVPIVRAASLAAGGAPKRVTVLHQRLVAFRSPDGTVGVMDEACPHRGASMALARNEPGGLRCVYHGWKIGAEGLLLEAPTHPPGAPLQNVRTGVHPAREAAGMVWTWLGTGAAPEFPRLAFGSLPPDQFGVITTRVRCSWLNMFESLWDSFHAQILHGRTNRVLFGQMGRGRNYFADLRYDADNLDFVRPEMSAELTEFGVRYTHDDAVKTTHFVHVMPWYIQHPTGPLDTDDQAAQGYVPIDDDNSMLIQWMFNPAGPLRPDGYGRMLFDGVTDPDDFASGLPRDGVWGQDRAAMARGSYNGLPEAGVLTISHEDIAMGESQGRLDRSRESLGPTDVVLIKGRRMFLDAVKAHARGERPFALGADASGLRARFIAKRPATAAKD